MESMFVKKMAVYRDTNLGNESICQQATIALTAWMRENHYDLVYGGGNVGLVGTVADTLLAEDGKVIGVMPTFLMGREIVHSDITRTHTISDMYARKKKVIGLADVYLILSGDPGMLGEISEVIPQGRVGEYMNPCTLYSVNGYYDLLVTFFDKTVETNFLTEADRAKIFISDSLEEIDAFIDSYGLPVIRQYRK